MPINLLGKIDLESYKIKLDKIYLENALNQEELELDKDYILNMLKSEIASAHWGKDEAIGIRLNYDSQVMDAIKYFNEAAGFINNSQ